MVEHNLSGTKVDENLVDRAEIFLIWLTNQSRGTYVQLLRTISSYFAEELGTNSSWGARRVVVQLQHLGFLKVDWSSGNWVMRPPRVYLLPGGMALAALRGGRQAAMLQDLESAGLFPKSLSALGSTEEPGYLPQTILLEFDEIDEAQAACEALRLPFETRYVERLASSLLPIGYSTLAAGPTSTGAPLQKYDPSTYQYTDVGFAQIDGLYRQQGFGLTRYWARVDNRWYQTTRAEGQWLATSQSQQQLLKWDFVYGVYGSRIGTLTVPSALVFPFDHVEVLASCSGVLPVRISGQRLLFNNIPESVYAAICNSLSPRLQAATSNTSGR